MLPLGEMAKLQPLTCDEKTRKLLERRASSKTELHRHGFRARIILGCLGGCGVMELARALKTRPNTIIKWPDRFAARQLEGLEDQKRPGAPRRLPVDLREHMLRVLEDPPLRAGARGWRCRGAALGGFAACGVAHLAQRRDLPATAALLVRQYGPRVRGQSRRYCRTVFGATDPRAGDWRGRETEHSSFGAGGRLRGDR